MTLCGWTAGILVGFRSRLRTERAEAAAEAAAASAARAASGKSSGLPSGMGIPGGGIGAEAAAYFHHRLPGSRYTAGTFALRALGYGTLLAMTGGAVVTLGVAWYLDTWTLMDFADKMLVIMPRAKDGLDRVIGRPMRRMHESIDTAAPKASSAVERAAQAADGTPRARAEAEARATSDDVERMLQSLSRRERRDIDEAVTEWNQLEAEAREGQARRLEQMRAKGLEPPPSVTVPTASAWKPAQRDER